MCLLLSQRVISPQLSGATNTAREPTSPRSGLATLRIDIRCVDEEMLLVKSSRRFDGERPHVCPAYMLSFYHSHHSLGPSPFLSIKGLLYSTSLPIPHITARPGSIIAHDVIHCPPWSALSTSSRHSHTIVRHHHTIHCIIMTHL